MEAPATTHRENIRFVAAVVSAICLVILVPLHTWAILTLVDHGNRLAVIEAWRGEGPRYTRYDAVRDFAPVVEKVNDHELRIRHLEQRPERTPAP